MIAHDLRTLERIALRTRKAGECIEWQGARSSYGYGLIWINGRNRHVHRMAYEAMYGPVPRELHMDHLCRNRRCVRLDHLEPVTPKENARRSPLTQASINASKTHCKHGHEFTPENTMKQRGGRLCRACELERQKRYNARRPERARV